MPYLTVIDHCMTTRGKRSQSEQASHNVNLSHCVFKWCTKAVSKTISLKCGQSLHLSPGDQTFDPWFSINGTGHSCHRAQLYQIQPGPCNAVLCCFYKGSGCSSGPVVWCTGPTKPILKNPWDDIKPQLLPLMCHQSFVVSKSSIYAGHLH